MTTTPPEYQTKRLAPGTPVVHLGEAEPGTIVRVATYRRNGQDAWSYLVDTASGQAIWEAGEIMVQLDPDAATRKPSARNTPVDPNALAAPQAYHAYTHDIARLIDVLQLELEKHAAAAHGEPKNWCRVGDLGKVRSDLLDLVGFLSGMERKQVEAFLAE